MHIPDLIPLRHQRPADSERIQPPRRHEKAHLLRRDRPEARPERRAALRPHHPRFCPAGEPCSAGGAGQAAALQHAAGDGGPLGHRPGHQGQPDHWKVPIDARGDLAHAVITSGGVSVREVDPKTMQSKKALGLYFAGEVLDVDAYTGGYNLQIAFCTAQSFANNL